MRKFWKAIGIAVAVIIMIIIAIVRFGSELTNLLYNLHILN